MGMFSYMCKVSGNQIRSDLDEHDPKQNIVRLYYLVNGVVQEEIRGFYNGYGAVELEDQTKHLLRIDGEMVDVLEELRSGLRSGNITTVIKLGGNEIPCEPNENLWLCENWDIMVDKHFDSDEKNGFCAVLETYVGENFCPTTISKDDPNQGWKDEDEEEEFWDDF